MGDVVLSTPLIRALRETYPDAFIAALVRSYARDVLLHNPHLNEILVDEAEGQDAGAAGFWRQVRRLRRRKFNVALLLLPTERLAWMLFASGIRTRVSVGVKLYQVLTFMKMVSRHKYVPLRHEADYCLDLGRAVGVQGKDLSTEVFLTEEERRMGGEILRSAGIPPGSHAKIILLHPGSGRSSPNWRPEQYAALANLCLHDEAAFVVITGGRNEVPLKRAFGLPMPPRLVDLIGSLSVRELMAVIANSSLLVSASTGPMHVAAALGIPTVSLFCRMSACSEELWGPKGNRAEIVRPTRLYCDTRCPGDPHVCEFEEGIFPGQVHERICQVLMHGGDDGALPGKGLLPNSPVTR